MVDSVDKKRKKTNTCDQVSHEGSNENQQSKKRRYERVPWQFRYDQLVEFRNQFGHTNVPQNYAKNMKLAAWVKFQRSQYKTGTLIQERINQLNELSFVWDLSRTVPWQFRYDQLVEFHNNYGHTNVPQSYAKNMKLGKWVNNQRSRYKSRTLTKERIDQLNELKFEWSKKVGKKSSIDMPPAQRLVSWRQLTPKQTTELLGVIRKISNENDAAFLSFETKDTTSRALKYLLSAFHQGFLQYPDTCDPKVVQWNGVSKFCINSHIALLIALFMALRNDDDHQFSIEEWDEIHTEVMYGCQNAIDQEKQVEKRGCNSNPLTGSTIKKSGEVVDDGKVVWERTFPRPSNHNIAQIRNSSLQFTGGGTEECSKYIRKTVMGVSIVWPEFNNTITVQAIQDLGKSLMNHLSITDHSVVGKLLEMRHWHSMNYFGHRPVGFYWFHKDGGTLSSMTNGEMESVASKGAQWIQGTFKHK